MEKQRLAVLIQQSAAQYNTHPLKQWTIKICLNALRTNKICSFLIKTLVLKYLSVNRASINISYNLNLTKKYN